MSHRQVIAWKPLGELLIERGLLSTEDLEAALAEQKDTGQLLGAILVARKAIAGAVLTMVLAEQAGVELETQNGFGSGLFSKIAGRNGAEAPALRSAAPELPSFEFSLDMHAAPPDPAFELSALRAELESLRARNVQLEQELVAKRKPRRNATKPS